MKRDKRSFTVKNVATNILPRLCAAALIGAACHTPAAAQGPSDQETFACLQGISPSTPLSRVPAAARRAAVACVNREVAAAINAQAPLHINSITTLRSAFAVGTVLQYQYEVDANAQDFTPDDISDLDKIGRANSCPEMGFAISMGATFAFVWLDRNGRIIHRLRIERC
jgi:hypothetical protein